MPTPTEALLDCSAAICVQGLDLPIQFPETVGQILPVCQLGVERPAALCRVASIVFRYVYLIDLP